MRLSQSGTFGVSNAVRTFCSNKPATTSYPFLIPRGPSLHDRQHAVATNTRSWAVYRSRMLSSDLKTRLTINRDGIGDLVYPGFLLVREVLYPVVRQTVICVCEGSREWPV
jgi:hypothetical protein